jgi:hypothetical protein
MEQSLSYLRVEGVALQADRMLPEALAVGDATLEVDITCVGAIL